MEFCIFIIGTYGIKRQLGSVRDEIWVAEESHFAFYYWHLFGITLACFILRCSSLAEVKCGVLGTHF
jgi:hypothetical protein